MKLIFGYYRISKESKNLEEKKENIINKFKKAIFYKDIYVNSLDIRRNWENLKLILKKGDTVIFHSIHDIANTFKEGIKEYFSLTNKNINLIFLNEPYINTEIYQEQIDAINKLNIENEELNQAILIRIKKLTKKQIKIAFNQGKK